MIDRICIALTVFSALIASNSLAEVSSDAVESHVEEARRQQAACGPNSLWYALRTLGHDVALSELLAAAEVEESGVPLSRVLELAQRYEPAAQAIGSKEKDLPALSTPALLVTNKDHCIVYLGTLERGKTARLYDPAARATFTVPIEIAKQSWTGEAIVFSEGDSEATVLVANTAVAVGLSALVAWWLIIPANRKGASTEGAPV